MNYKYGASNIISYLETKIEKYGAFKYSEIELNKYLNNYEAAILEKVLLEKNIYKFPIDNDSFWLVKTESHNLTLDNKIKDLGNINSSLLPFIPVTKDITQLNKIDVFTIIQSSNIINGFLREESLMLFCKSINMPNKNFRVSNNRNTVLNLLVNGFSIKDLIFFESKNTIYLLTDYNKINEPLIFYSNIYFRNEYKKDVKIIKVEIANSLVEMSLGFYESYDSFNSFSYIKKANYRLIDYCIKKSELIEVFKSISREHAFVTFPQADNLEIIYKLIDYIDNEETTYDEIAQAFKEMGSDIVDRQINYYIIAAIYIGIIAEVGLRKYSLTYLGLSLQKKGIKEKRLSFIKAIISKPVFYETFKLYTEKNEMPSRPEIISIMNKEIPEKLSNSTISRRSSTVRSWFAWIFKDLA